MKAIKFLVLLIVTAMMGTSCSAQSEKSSEKIAVAANDEVQVYYFHNTRRCATCKAVESETQKILKEAYGDKVAFTSLNLEEKAGEEKAEELGVSGQTLLIVCGDKKYNITNHGFMNARTNPEKLKDVILTKIDPLL